jgi:glutamate-ammonia-ligase adenylyltransferase
VNREDSEKAIRSLSPGIDSRILGEFFARMDEDYFELFPPEEIAAHIRLSTTLTSGKRAEVRIAPRPSNPDEFDIVIVGFDYLSEFSVFCGLLAAFGLDIHAGSIFSFSRRFRSPLAAPGRIVDVFSVKARADKFDEGRQREFSAALQDFALLLEAGLINEARERLNRFLTERIERMNAELIGLLAPVNIRFDNALSPEWTVMDIRSQDTFGFLYAVANALAMRGVDIHKVRISSESGEARDRFFIADRAGRKIEDETDRRKLQVAVQLLTGFTAFLPDAPDPARAMRHFDRFLDKAAANAFPDRLMTFLAGSRGMSLIASVLGSSDFLWDDFLDLRFDDLLPVLENLAELPPRSRLPDKESLGTAAREGFRQLSTFEERRAWLNRFKDTQLFLIDVQHLLAPTATLVTFSEALTDLAEVIVEEAAAECYRRLAAERGTPLRDDGTAAHYAICGLGKFGGREMGYASDLELLIAHDAPGAADFFEAFVRQIVNFIETRPKGIFHIDLRLRPHGDAGPLASSIEHLEQYYSENGQAAPFERQALIKLRRVAGDETLGRRVEARRDLFTYGAISWNREDALHLRRRQTRELAAPGKINVKYSAGGIIDIEYAAQYMQLERGGADTALRVPNTLEALDRLHHAHVLFHAEHARMRADYLFLRNLIDALRIVRGDATDLTLPDPGSDEFKSLARRLGYREADRRAAARRLDDDIRTCMKQVHEMFAARFPLKEFP